MSKKSNNKRNNSFFNCKDSATACTLGIPILLLLTLLGVVLAITTHPQPVDSFHPVEIQGFKFFDSVTGDEFVVRGVDYYPRPNHGDLNLNSLDLFSDDNEHIWKRDIPYLQELGVNAIRLYAVNASKNHDAFMCALQQAGIYVIVALAHDCPTCAITKDSAPECYPAELKEQGQAVINAFAKYPNTLAFSAGNEVNHFAPLGMPEWNAPCQKKFIRDMRAYIASCPKTIRKVPVGLVTADSDRDENAMYYNCQTDPDDLYDTAEWYGLNSYVYCNGNITSYDNAKGFQRLADSFRSYNYSIPVLLTEFGCLSDTFPKEHGYEGQRNFLQAKWMLEHPDLQNLFSGGIAFEYSIEKENAGGQSPYPFKKMGKQNYGIGYLGPENCDDINTPCEYTTLPAFDNLKDIYHSQNVTRNVTRNTFVIPPNRQGRSICPDHFPSLKEYVWKTDDVPFGHCPSRRHSEFTCPAGLFGTGKGGRQHEQFPWIKACLVGGLMAILAIYLAVVLPCSPDVVTSNNIPILEWAIVPRRSSESDTSSDESEALLSMKGVKRSKAPYQAVTMDYSSSEGELE